MVGHVSGGTMRKSALLPFVAALLLSGAAFAQIPPGAEPGKAPAQSRMRDCSKAPDPAQCEARRQKARETFAEARQACEGKQGKEHGACMRQQMCALAPDPAWCEERGRARAEMRQRAHEACKDRQGEERRNCLRDQRRQHGAPRS
jgi:hypothetical protein